MNLKLAKLLRRSARIRTGVILETTYEPVMQRGDKKDLIDHFIVSPNCVRGVYKRLKKELRNG